MDKRYLQLYSIKDETAKDFVEALKRVKAAGYTGIEFAGNYGNMSASDLKKLLAELELEPLSAHIVADNVAANLDYCAELGLKYIIDPYQMMKTDEEVEAFSKKLNEVGRMCKEKGIKFGYHNHEFEFAEGKNGTLMDTMLLNTDPDLVCFQLDVGWVANAGHDPVAFINKHAGRISMIHVKEWCNDKGWDVASGKGSIDWPAVRDAALAQGAEGFVVEREHDYAGNIYTCIEEDCAFLKTL